MDGDLNPYTPGSGVMPTSLIGRQEQIGTFESLLKRASNGLSVRPQLLIGLRGVGKTVLLNHLRDMATEAEWITVKIEAVGRSQPGRRRRAENEEAMRQSLAVGLARAAQHYSSRSSSTREALTGALAAITSFNFSVGVTNISLGVERDTGRASSGNLEIDLMDVVEVLDAPLRADKKGFALFIDEMQELSDELMSSIIAVQHEASQRRVPFVVIGAGLPSLPALLSASRSYAERMFNATPIDRLPIPAALVAMTQPAKAMGAAFDTDAALHLVTESGGYPYFIQEFGAAIWDAAPSSPFTTSDALVATERGKERLDAQFVPARWDPATPAEREYLIAMSADGGAASSTSDVAIRMDRELTALGPTRANLIAKGLVFSPDRGKVAFTVPGFDAYIARRSDTD